MALLPDPFSIFPKGVWARDYDVSMEIADTEWTPRLLISSLERRDVYSRATFIMYILVNCRNSGRGPGSRSVGMLRGIVKNLQLKRCVERSLLLCSSHLLRTRARGHAGASGHARIDSSPHPLNV